MDKIFLVLKREYLIRVRKKSFIIMTILAPLLFLAISILPTYFLLSNTDTKRIGVIDESGLFKTELKDTEVIKYKFIQKGLEDAKKELSKNDFSGVVYIPKMTIEEPKGVFIYFEDNVGVMVEEEISRSLEKIVKEKRLAKAGLTQQQLNNLEVIIPVTSTEIQADTKTEVEKSTEAASAIGYVCGIMIYMFIFIYGNMVMKGVVEEKTSRIIEVMLSSIKPFQLMMGKILGISLVGLTQLLLWIVLTVGVSSGVAVFYGSTNSATQMESAIKAAENTQTEMLQNPAKKKMDVMFEFKKAVGTINIPLVVGSFMFFFLGGYLLYASLFAAIGAAGDSETDAQQFTLPISIPLLVALMASSAIIKDPGSTLAIVLSIFPLTSPIIMMVRIPFGVPIWELIASIVSLIAGFIFFTWFAARIYRVGILMYGKKPTYKELSKWLFYKI